MLELKIADQIARLTLNWPPVNSINDEWISKFHRILDDVTARSDCRVLHIRSAVKTFSAGFDLKLAVERLGTANGAGAMGESTRELRRLYARIEALKQITIAEIAGAAVGGGLELALACDLRIGARTAKFGLPEVKLGLLPAAGGTQRLVRLCGRSTALRLILGSEVVTGDIAAQLGLIQWVVPSDDIAAFTDELARRYAAQPEHAVHWAKVCIAAADLPDGDGFAEEQQGATVLAKSDTTRELVTAFFNGTE